ncbi:prephenate dehydrogenase [Lachnospiraceae bacterium C10]|nr:prephenate dehydrogenase [Lachnospiraceae bacterium C10]
MIEDNFRNKKIVFIGLGLIGGSIAKAIHERYPDQKIYAHARHEETILAAYKDDLILNDHLLSIEEIASSDLIFLCCPVGSNADYMKQIAPYIGEHTIITDVGSVKGDIHLAAKEAGLSEHFIGGHPMTGSEAIGYEHSSSHFLENAYYILTADNDTSRAMLPEFAEYISSLGSITLQLHPDEHDFATAAISHLPHVISASLVNLVRSSDKDEVLKTIAAGGFRDITRISSSSPEMWQHICKSNKKAIIQLLDLYNEELTSFRNAIDTSDDERLHQLFSSAKDYRDSLPLRKTGVLGKAFVLYSDLRDEAGQIATVATILANNGISIKNIGIIHNREFEEGVLSIELYNQKDYQKAGDLLSRHGYILHKRN